MWSPLCERVVLYPCEQDRPCFACPATLILNTPCPVASLSPKPTITEDHSGSGASLLCSRLILARSCEVLSIYLTILQRYMVRQGRNGTGGPPIPSRRDPPVREAAFTLCLFSWELYACQAMVFPAIYNGQ